MKVITRVFKCSKCPTGIVSLTEKSQGFKQQISTNDCNGCGAFFGYKGTLGLEEIKRQPEGPITSLNQIDTSTETGKMLLAAVAYLTDQSPSITPEEALAKLAEYRARAFKEELPG